MYRQQLIWSLILTLVAGTVWGFTVNGKRMVVEGDPITLFRTMSAARTVTDAQIYKWDNMSGSGGSYTHPATHPATMIVQDSSNRFVTDAQMTTWNGKQSPTTTLAGYGITDAAPSSHIGAGGSAHSAATSGSAGFMAAADKSKLDGLSNYTHPATHPPSIIAQDSSNRFVTDAQMTTWNGKVATSSTSTTPTIGQIPIVRSDGSLLIPNGLVFNAGGWITGNVGAQQIILASDGAINLVTATGKLLRTQVGTGGAYEIWHDGNIGGKTATSGAAGSMAAADKSKLDGLSNYTHPVPSIITPTLLNSWVNSAGGYILAGYSKTAENLVTLQGVIQNGANGSVAFTLPAGYRPGLQHIYRVGGDIDGNVRTDVAADGNVIISQKGANTTISLSGITFKATQ